VKYRYERIYSYLKKLDLEDLQLKVREEIFWQHQPFLMVELVLQVSLGQVSLILDLYLLHIGN